MDIHVSKSGLAVVSQKRIGTSRRLIVDVSVFQSSQTCSDVYTEQTEVAVAELEQRETE